MLHKITKRPLELLVTLTACLLIFNPQAKADQTAEVANDPSPITESIDTKLSVAEQIDVVHGLSQVLKENYLFPDKAERMAMDLQRFSTQSLLEPIEAQDLAIRLTEKLYELSDDLHFFVEVDPEWIAQQRLMDQPEQQRAIRAKERLQEEQQNFSFKEVKILEGNVGYLSFSYFSDPEIGYRKLATSMEFLSHCEAYIIDLRNNNGGFLQMAQLLASYFFTNLSDQLLFDYYYFEDGVRVERKQWVLPSVPGERRPDAPLYILVSSASFSAAEWFAYVLGGLGRAEVVGEQTAGGAHPVDRKVIDHQFVVNVPIGQIRGPVGEGDFEGVGVAPHEKVAAREALHVAHRMAIDELKVRNPESLSTYEWILPVIDARREPVALDTSRMRLWVGDYGGSKISLEDGVLYYSRNGKGRIELTPLSDNLLALEGIDSFRFRLIESEGKVTGLERLYLDGHTRQHWKTP